MTTNEEDTVYKLTELHHQVMRLLCDGKNVTEVARAIHENHPEMSEDKARKLMQYDSQRESIYYQLSMLVYNGKREVRDQAHAVHLYTLRYLCPQPDLSSVVEPTQPVIEPVLQQSQSWAKPVVITLLITLYMCCLLFLFVPASVAQCDDCFTSYYTNLYFLIPLIGGICGLLRRYRLPQTTASLYVRPFTLFSFALFMWGMGNAVYLWFAVQKWQTYPSYADIFYLTDAVCWTVGMCLVYNTIDTWPNSFLLTLISVAFISAIALWLSMLEIRHLTVNLAGDPLELVLDVAYPWFEVINLTLFLGLIRKSSEVPEHHIYRAMRLFSVAMVLNFSADLIFSITNAEPTGNFFGNINGSYADILYATAFAILGVGVSLIPLE